MDVGNPYTSDMAADNIFPSIRVLNVQATGAQPGPAPLWVGFQPFVLVVDQACI